MAVDLLSALGIGRGVVSLVGAGGKTTLLYRLASLAHAAGRRVLVTTTTHMGAPPEDVGPVLYAEADDPSPRVRAALLRHGRATLLGERVREDKVTGIPPGSVDALAGLADLVLVEADGARRRSLKLPAGHEPVVPRSTGLVVVVAGLDVLGQPLDEAHVHRLERVAAAAAQAPGSLIGEETIARALAAPDGYLSRLPAGARAAVFLNKAEDTASRAAAERIARRLCPPYGRAVAGSARGDAATVVTSP
jgi:probable selenium-dependent hydroxylase accessory protein YqeC